MGRITIRWILLAAVVLALFARAALGVGEFADVYLNDGRHFFGKILEERTHKLVVEVHHGSLVVEMTFGADDIDRIERHEKATGDDALDGDDDDIDAWRDGQDGAPAQGGYAIVPIDGVFGEELTAGLFERALREAERSGAEAVIFHLDSPGGMVVELDRIRDVLDDYEREMRIAFYVDREAFSAAALLCLSSEDFYVGKGARVGAAVAFRIESGAAQVDAKFTAAFAATWRSRAERAGREPAIVDAMIDMERELWADTRTEPWTVHAEPPAELRPGHGRRTPSRGRPRGRRGEEPGDMDEDEGFDDGVWKQLDDKEHVLALTDTEALNIGAADGSCRDVRDVVEELHLAVPKREAFDGERFSDRYFRSYRNNMERARRAVRDASEAAGMLGKAENAVEYKGRLREIMANLNRVIRMYERHDYVRNYIDSQGQSIMEYEDVVRKIRRILSRG